MEILSNSIERNHPSRTFPVHFVPKVVRVETEEVIFGKLYVSPRPPPKISLKHQWQKNWVRKLLDNQKGKLLDNQKEKLLDKQNSTQPTPNPIRDRSGRPDDMQDERKTSRSQEISVNSFCEELSSSDGTGRLVETEEIQAPSSEDSKSLNVEQTHDGTGRPVHDTVAVQDDPQVYHEAETLNIDDETLRGRIEADMDFKIPGPPHSIVTHAQSTSVRELIQKIENHPDRHAFSEDLQQNQSFNFFSPKTKQMIRDFGNIELCELLETEPKNTVNSMFVILEHWYPSLHVLAIFA